MGGRFRGTLYFAGKRRLRIPDHDPWTEWNGDPGKLVSCILKPSGKVYRRIQARVIKKASLDIESLLKKKHCWSFYLIRSELTITSLPYKVSLALVFHLAGETKRIYGAIQKNAPLAKFGGGGCISPCPSLRQMLSKRRARSPPLRSAPLVPS